MLLATEAGWKISQYNLSMTIPNELADEFAKRIAARGKKAVRE